MLVGCIVGFEDKGALVMKNLRYWVAGLGIWFLMPAVLFSGDLQKMVVCVPVADVRHEKEALPFGVRGPALCKDMKGQLSQVLLGERIMAEAVSPGWLRVELLDQKNLHKDKLSNIVGYVQDHQAVPVQSFPICTAVVHSLWAPVFYQHKKILSISSGTKLQAKRLNDEWCKVLLPAGKIGLVRSTDISFVQPPYDFSSEQLGTIVCQLARQFVGSPYVWGGRSAHALATNNQITSLDCSSLVNLVYQIIGLQVPRNSRSQFGVSKVIADGNNLQPGDLIFFGLSQDPVFSVSHVGIYVGDDTFIEASGRDKSLSTRISTVKDIAGDELTNLKHGQQCVGGLRSNEYIFFGSLLADRALIQKMHDDWLGND